MPVPRDHRQNSSHIDAPEGSHGNPHAAGPLTGLVVVAVEQAVAAPFCTMRLADAGATVIKVERPEGDFARGYDDVAGGESSYFVWLNRGKESVVLDLKQPAARASLWTLIAGADVFIHNLKVGALAKLGFDASIIRSRFPRLITCAISGYGETGPMSSRKAYDLLIQAESGLASLTGSPQEPARVGISIVDIATGLTAYSAVMEALIARSNTALGCDIQVSMFDVMADWLTVPLLHQENGRAPARLGLAHPSIAPYGVFRSGDGVELLISIQSDREWQSLSTNVLRDVALCHDPRFATNVARVKNRVLTDRLVAEAFARFDRKALLEILAKADVAFAEVNDMAALSHHPHLRRICVTTGKGTVSLPAPGFNGVGAPRTYGDVPKLGQHSSALAKQAVQMARGRETADER